MKPVDMAEVARHDSLLVTGPVSLTASPLSPASVDRLVESARQSVLRGQRDASREEVIGRAVASVGAGLASGCWYLALGLTDLAPMPVAMVMFSTVLFCAVGFLLLMFTPLRRWNRDRDLQTSILLVSSAYVLVAGQFLDPMVRVASLMWMAVSFSFVSNLYPTAALLRRAAILGLASAVMTAIYVERLEEREAIISWLGWCAYMGYVLLTSQVAGFLRSYRARTHRSRAMAEAALAAISEAVLLLDPQRRILSANRAAMQMLASDGGSIEMVPFDAIAKLERIDADPLVFGPDASVDERLHRLTVRGGHSFDVEVLSSPLASGSGSALGEVVLLRDVTATHRLMRQMEHESRHDSLTGLHNRAGFLSGIPQRLSSMDAVGAEGPHAFLMVIDLDDFKSVNDACGHAAGDQLLRDIATVLRARLGPTALIARLGGDEFAALIRGESVDEARLTARRLLDDIDAFRFYRGQHVFRVRASAGMAEIALGTGELVTAVDQGLGNADAACYLAKELGRNRLHLFSSGDDEIARKRRDMTWAQEIRRAIEQNRFVLMGQRISSSSKPDDPSVELEVLLRMVDTEGNLVLPASFLPAAERFGLMRDVDQYVIRQALGLLAASPASRARLSINLSAASLQDETLAGRVRGWLDEAGISGTRICFEMTETAAVSNIAVATTTMNGLRALGCRLALDDVGSGFNSFSYLRALDVDRLKIDGSFVRSIANGSVDRIMVDSLYQIAQAVGIETVAEMVESPRLVEEVRAIGIEFMQGFAIHRPEPLRGLLRLDLRPGGASRIAVAGSGSIPSEEIGLVI